ncbi:MAG: TetR/AcrR family transcriptional regulator [Sporomusa sp.]
MIRSKRLQQKEETKKLIIKTAYKVYAEKGFSATTSDIAKQAGLSHGSIFSHFSTVNSLLICLIQEFGQVIGFQLHQLAVGSESIVDVLHAHVNVLAEYENFYTRLISEMSLLPEDAKHTLIMIQSTISFHLNKVAEREINNGNIKKIPMYIIFNTWLGLIHYYLQNRELFAPGASVLKQHGNELVKHFLELIKSNSPAKVE